MNHQNVNRMGLGRYWLCAALLISSASTQALDITTPEGSLLALIKMRADTSGKDVFADWKVTAWAIVPGKRAQALFRLDGFNVARMERQPDGGWRMISREVAYYRDVKMGDVLQTWANPFTGQVNEVLQVINDPVNLSFPSANAPTARRVVLDIRGDHVVLSQDVPLAYPNPLQPKDYPVESSGEQYIASEHFTYFAQRPALVNDATTSVPTHYSWTRLGPWLPWMKMGREPGYIMYVGNGMKVESQDQLDPVVLAYTKQHHPDFLKPPANYSQPNETSWTYFRKQRPPQMMTPVAPAAVASGATK